MNLNKYRQSIIKNTLTEYTSTVKSLHMPGHKNGTVELIPNIWSVDVTEVEGTDDLHHASGIIQEVHEKITSLYCKDGNYQSKMLINGSTGGILAAITATVKPLSTVLVARNCHKAVYHGMMLGNGKIDYIYPYYNREYAVYEHVESRDIEKKMSMNPEIKTVVITSPTYEGIVSDIKAIADVVHQYKGILIVDEAHGAHFPFSDQLPESAVNLGADIVIQSTHKTLPALTQTGLIHYNTTTVDVGRLEQCLGMFQSSSPSYPFMCSIEEAIDYMDNNRNRFDKLIEELNDLRGSTYKNFSLGEMDEVERDCLRLTLYINKSGVFGSDIDQVLRETHQIQVEMTGVKTIVAIISIADSIETIKLFLDLVDQEIEKIGGSTKPISLMKIVPNPEESIIKYSMNQVFNMKTKTVKIEQGINEVSGSFIIPYPPGIPLLAPGEMIQMNHIRVINDLLALGYEIYGIMDGELTVVIEGK